MRRIRLGAIVLSVHIVVETLVELSLAKFPRAQETGTFAVTVMIWSAGIWLLTTPVGSAMVGRKLQVSRLLLRVTGVIYLSVIVVGQFGSLQPSGVQPDAMWWLRYSLMVAIPWFAISLALAWYARRLAQSVLLAGYARLFLIAGFVSCAAWGVTFVHMVLFIGRMREHALLSRLFDSVPAKVIPVLWGTGWAISYLMMVVTAVGLWRVMTLALRRASALRRGGDGLHPRGSGDTTQA